jgi:hypothetical protein
VLDIWGVAANLLWVVGLALLLAVLSWSSWLASVQKVRFRAILARPGVRAALDLGLAVFSAGLAATAQTWWERVLWLVLAVWWLTGALLARRRRRDHPIANNE